MLSFRRNCLKYYTHFNRRNTSNQNPFLLKFHTLFHLNDPFQKNSLTSFNYYHYYSTKTPSRSYRRRARNRFLKANKPVLDQEKFQFAQPQLLPRFTPEELRDVIANQRDPLVCLELFHWASHQPRFCHNESSFHVTIKKLGDAKMYQEMDDVVNQLLAVRSIGNEVLFNMIIYYFTEARRLTRAVIVFKHMKSSRNPNFGFRPSIRTYNILFGAFLSRGYNTDINLVYMETMRCLFKQMVNEHIEPDIFSLNSMIKGYVLSLHVNDALRIFHQMGVVYECKPNSLTYDYLLCCTGAGTVPGTGTGAGTGYGIFQKTKVRVRLDNLFILFKITYHEEIMLLKSRQIFNQKKLRR